MNYLFSTLSNMMLTEFLESDDIPHDVKLKILANTTKKLAELSNPLAQEQRVTLSSTSHDLEQCLYFPGCHSNQSAIIKAKWHKPECDA